LNLIVVLLISLVKIDGTKFPSYMWELTNIISFK